MIFKKISLLGFLLFFLFSSWHVFGYDNLNVHPMIVNLAATSYNNQANNKLTKQQIEWMINGSIAEDAHPRYLNHFFNPETNQGLDEWDNIEGIYKRVQGDSTLNWIVDQTNFSGITGDYSEKAILENYRNGDMVHAYQGIGHMLHLIQDMSVPAHVRNDPHYAGDSYEKWAQNNGKIAYNNFEVQQTSNLKDSIIGLANYAHDNFFSQDSIDNTIYRKVDNIKKEKNAEGVLAEYGYYNNYKIIRVLRGLNRTEYLFDSLVYQDYWNMLYPKAVSYSAGAIDYFVKQFDKIDEEQKSISVLDKLKNYVAYKFNNVGEIVKYAFGDKLIRADSVYQKAGVAAEDIGGTINRGTNKTVAVVRIGVDKTIKTTSNAVQKTTQVVADTIKAITPKPTGQVLGIKVVQAEEATPSAIVTKENYLSDPNLDAPAPVSQGPILVLWTPPVQAPVAPSVPEEPVVLDTTPPEVYIVSAPCAFSSSTTAYFEFGSNEDNISYQCQIDDADPALCGSMTTLNDLSDGMHSLAVFGADASGNTSSTTLSMWSVDTVAPTSGIIALADKQGSADFTVAWEGSDAGTSSSGILSYKLQYAIGTTSVWQDWLSGITSTSTIFSEPAINGDIVYFRVQASDIAGNSGDWSAEATTTLDTGIADHIVISEFTTRGPAAGREAYDEFVELYNPTDSEINLSGWSLESKTPIMNWWTNRTGSGLPDKIIKPKSYFLIAAKDYSLNATPDYRHSANWGIPDDRGSFRLVNSNGVEIDKVWFGSMTDPDGPAIPFNFNGKGSAERAARMSSTAVSMDKNGDDYWKGNGVDREDNVKDFVFRAAPEPQNSYSPSEPNDNPGLIPEKISDLAVEHIDGASFSLSWTAPINANVSGGAYYEIRYRQKNGICNLINNWDTASQTIPYLLPSAYPGQAESLELSGLIPDVGYCFGIRVFNGMFWSEISGEIIVAPVCSQTQPAFTGSLAIRHMIADKTTASTTPDEPIVVFDFIDTQDSGLIPFAHSSDNCTPMNDISWGDSTATRLIVEAEYDPGSGLYTGRYRFCTDNPSTPVVIQNDRCTDNSGWWVSNRWLASNFLTNAQEISISNSSQYTPWVRP